MEVLNLLRRRLSITAFHADGPWLRLSSPVQFHEEYEETKPHDKRQVWLNHQICLEAWRKGIAVAIAKVTGNIWMDC